MSWDGSGSGGYNYDGGSSNNVRYIPIVIDSGGGPRPSQPQPYYPQPSGPSRPNPSAKNYPPMPVPSSININNPAVPADGQKKVVKGLEKDDFLEMEELTKILNNKKKQGQGQSGGTSQFTPGSKPGYYPGPSPAAGSSNDGRNNWDNQPFPIFKNPYLQEPTSTGGHQQPPQNQNQPSYNNPYSQQQPQPSFNPGPGVPNSSIGFAMPPTVPGPGQPSTTTSLPYPTNPCPYPTPGPNFYPGYPQ